MEQIKLYCYDLCDSVIAYSETVKILKASMLITDCKQRINWKSDVQWYGICEDDAIKEMGRL